MLTQPMRRRNPASSPPPRRSGGANDNQRGRMPTNDNRRPRVRVPLNPARLARYGSNLLRINPYFRLASDALNVLEMFSNFQQEGWKDLGPWSLYAKCASPSGNYAGPYAANSRGSAPPGSGIIGLVNSCTVGQAILAGTMGDPWNGVTSSHRTVAMGRTIPFGATYRCQLQEVYGRPNTGAFTKPTYQNASPAIALPANAPTSWPLSVYPELAAPFAAPAFAAPRPWGKPNLRGLNSQASNDVVSNPAIRPDLGKPSEVPNDWSVSYEDGPVRVGAPETHTLAPPARSGRTEREGKIKAPKALALALHAIAPVTEMFDLIEALYDALPEEYRPRYKDTPYEKLFTTPQEKFAALYQHFDKVNLYDALQNIASNEIEDRIIGTFGQMGANASINQGLVQGGGFNSALRPTRKYIFEYQNSAGIDNTNE